MKKHESMTKLYVGEAIFVFLNKVWVSKFKIIFLYSHTELHNNFQKIFLTKLVVWIYFQNLWLVPIASDLNKKIHLVPGTNVENKFKKHVLYLVLNTAHYGILRFMYAIVTVYLIVKQRSCNSQVNDMSLVMVTNMKRKIICI